MVLNQHRLFCSYTIVVGLFAAVLMLASYLGLDWSHIRIAWVVSYSLCGALGLYLFFRNKHKYVIDRSSFFINRLQWPLWLVVVAGFSLYYIWAGVYDLVPGDVFRHLERLQFTLYDYQYRDNPTTAYSTGIGDYYLYYFWSIVAVAFNLEITEILFVASWLSGVIYLSAFYWFAVALFNSKPQRAPIIALLACIILLLWKGFAGFPFLRYYALSAVLWMLPIYFYAVLLVDQLLSHGSCYKKLLALAMALLVTSLYHLQETLFIVVVGVLLLGFYSVKAIVSQVKPSEQTLMRSRRSAIIILVVMLLALVLFYLYCYVSYTPSAVDHRKLWNIAPYLGIGQPVYILNPFFQFNQVMTHFGVSVYLLALFYWRQLIRMPIIFCSLCVPLVTVFNPLFVDLMLRVRDAHIIYRFLYVVPIALTAAWLSVRLIESFRYGTLRKKIISGLALTVLVLCIWPQTQWHHVLRYSRISGLAPVDANQSATHWQDLIVFFQSIPNRQWLYTDPVTGYVLSALTGHYSPGYKFYGTDNPLVNRAVYSDDVMAPYVGRLLVVNLREGGLSKAGVLSQHWSRDVLKLKQYYSEALLDYLNTEPELLTLIYQSDDVRVYRIGVMP